MKFKIILFIFLFTSLLSCEQFLEEKPYSTLSSTNFPQTEEDARIALNGVYNVYSRFWIVGYNGMLFLTADSELTSYGGNYGTGRAIYQDFQRTTADEFPGKVWTDLYLGVNTCNFVIEAIEKGKFAGGDKLIAEAKALRAWFYIELTNYFGDVPLKITSTEGVSELKLPRAGADEVRQQILHDITDAETIMKNYPQTFAIHNRGGLVTLGMVKMMKARLYAYMAGWRRSSQGQMVKGDASLWTDVRDVCKEIMDMGIYSIEPEYVKLWRDLFINIYNKESIWELDYSMPSRGNNFAEAMTGPSRAAGRSGGFFNMRSTSAFYDSFDPFDVRRDWSVNWSTHLPNYVMGPNTRNSQIPFIQKFRKFNDLGDFLGNSPQNLSMYRYSDVLLMYAEALNEINNGPTPEAYAAINAIRYRARPADHKNDGMAVPDLAGLNYDGFKSAIMKERAFEFAFEGYRRMDLIRWGKYMEVLQAFPDALVGMKKAANVRPYHMLLPVPQQEMNLNQAWIQNDGW